LNADNPQTAVVFNPGSFRIARRDRWRRIDSLARDAGIIAIRVHDLSGIEQAVRDAVRVRAERLILIGGDGTLQAAVTALAGLGPEPAPPRLMILGGGRSNYVARDLGSHHNPLATLEKALKRPAAMKVERRTSLGVHQSGKEVQHGFFFGAALVDDIIRDCHDYQAGPGFWRRGHLSTPLRLAQRGAMALIGQSRFEPPTMTIEATRLGRLEAPIRLLLVATLRHRRQFIDPYADHGTGAIRLTAVAAGARGFWPRLYRLLRGRYHPGMVPEAGYLSGATDRLAIQGLPGISLDGQAFDFDPCQPVEILPGPEFEFLIP